MTGSRGRPRPRCLGSRRACGTATGRAPHPLPDGRARPGRDLVAVASATDGPKVTLWDYRDPRAPRAAASMGPVGGDAPELTFSGDGTVLAVEGGQDAQRKLGLWRVDTPERPQALLNREANDLTEP